MPRPIFITGIGTDVGKTVVSAIIVESLNADYWKPVQAGYDDGTDSEWIRGVLANSPGDIYPEAYRLKLAASPHIAAREEDVRISLTEITGKYNEISNQQPAIQNGEMEGGDQPSVIAQTLIIEGAGGLLVPLNENEFVIDLIKRVKARVILVSRNYLGSINHSLLTAAVCKQNGLDVIGWVFNDHYLSYEDEIVHWSAFPKIASVPFCKKPDREFITEQAQVVKPLLLKLLQ
jgi:dethiobiotin synthetase